MAEKPTFWKKTGLQDLFLPSEKTQKKQIYRSLTPDEVYKYILDKFKESIAELSFANRIVFYHEYIICFNDEDYKEFLAHKQGLFGIIVHESVNQFYQLLDEYRKAGKTVEPSSSKWVFRLVSHPDYERGDKGFIGKLLPGTNQKAENLRVTFIPRQTGVAETLDVNQEILNGFTYYSEGYYEIPYAPDSGSSKQADQTRQKGYARLETIMPDENFRGKKLEYLMNSEQITVSGKDESRKEPSVFIVPSDWVNTPHLSIRHQGEGKFQLASFGEKTIVNEIEVPRSEEDAPEWVDLPFNSRILLNGIIGINIFKP
ncbi:hypothetical protein [Pedobacter hartonius]|uniref:FHA domain-containing protein n=1 Tax=Pedobacter hartonius TaxID=425514 RepID=A0A1H4AZ18_9SPHI|nr:hypothetical protein [Pedobacter hartonius]SEA41064.1 hypothetical protein SAMN05443550_103141 [Pedobacter hartonius]